MFDKGPIKKGTHKSLVKTAAKYVDKEGKTRYKGTGKDLKNTQLLSQQEFILLCAFFGYATTEIFLYVIWFPPELLLLSFEICPLTETVHSSLCGNLPGEPEAVSWGQAGLSRGFYCWKSVQTSYHYYPLGPSQLGIMKSICQVQPEEVILNSILSMETGDPWDDAELWSVYRYIRGSKNLACPQSYRPLLFQRAN